MSLQLRDALTTSIDNHKPLEFLGKLLADQRQVTQALKAALDSESGWLLQYDLEEWESEANDLSDLAAEMFRRFGR